MTHWLAITRRKPNEEPISFGSRDTREEATRALSSEHGLTLAQERLLYNHLHFSPRGLFLEIICCECANEKHEGEL